MNFNGFNNFEEFFRGFECKNNNGSTSNNPGCNDINGGFQDLNPEFFIVMGALIGDVLAGKLPFNVQNAVGNWLELVGQIMLTYNAQQQYFESGPGNYYNLSNKNTSNSNCPNNSNTDTTNNSKELDKLKDNIDKLTKEIEELKKDLERMKKE